MSDDTTFQLAFNLRRALQELNAIRASTGVPHDFYGHPFSVTEDYFSQVIEDGFAALEAAGMPYTPWDFKK